MLKELSRFESLGSPGIFLELFKLIEENNQRWNTKTLKEYLFNRIIDGQTIFDGCIPFALCIGAISKMPDEAFSVSETLKAALSNQQHLNYEILKLIFLSLKEDEAFHEIFSSKNLSFDIIYDQLLIDRGAFQFRYANFRHLLFSFSFLQEHPDPAIRRFIIHHKFRKFFDKNVLPEIKRKKIGIDELQKLLAQKQIHGSAAEEFVLRYEQKRLKGHPKFEAIQIISDYDVGAGYDIVSFDSNESASHDRFIEVKSYAASPGFHWSRNEIEKARYMKNQYFLYLVDRTKVKQEDYEPLKIQDPYHHVLLREDEWEKRVEDYHIKKLS